MGTSETMFSRIAGDWDELMSGTVSEMARRELCWAFYSITLLATCCTAIRRAEEFDDPKPPVEAATAELHSITWALYLLGYFLIVSSFGDAWTYVRERTSRQQIKALQIRIKSATMQAKSFNMPDTIVKSFKYEREALKLNKQVTAIEEQMSLLAITPVSRAVAFAFKYFFPVLPAAILGNSCLFCLGNDAFFWPLGWFVAPSGEVTGQGCVGTIAWSLLCVSASRYLGRLFSEIV